MITGIHAINDGSPIICNSYKYTKLTCKPIKGERTAPPANRFGEEIHSNVWGPSPTASLGGHCYYVTFTDDHTHYTCIDIIKTKDQTLSSYCMFTAWAQMQYGAKIKWLRSDHSGEYTSHKFTKFLQEEGTECRLTMHNTLQHNRVAESLNHCLLEQVCTMLHQSTLPKTLWGEALHFAVWLKNWTSTRALGSNTTPFKKLTGNKPNLSGVPEWGQTIWVHSGTRTKLNAHGIKARWVGYNPKSPHVHHIYWTHKNSVSVEQNIKFTFLTFTISLGPPHIITLLQALMPQV